MFYLFLHEIVVYRHFSLNMASKMAAKGHVTIFSIICSNKSFIYLIATFCESFTVIGWMVLEILCVEPIYPQNSGFLETCLALRYWIFEVLGSESVKG